MGGVLGGALAFAVLCEPAHAVETAKFVTSCGTAGFLANSAITLTITPDGRLCVSGAAPSADGSAAIAPIASTGPALVAKAAPGNLYGYQATAGGAAAFVALLNATVIPAPGAAIAPLECSAVPANGTYRTRQDIPDRYTTGIVLVFTNSCSTFIAGTPALIGAVVQ